MVDDAYGGMDQRINGGSIAAQTEMLVGKKRTEKQRAG